MPVETLTAVPRPPFDPDRAERIADAIDLASETLLHLLVFLAPWAFGTTQPWSISLTQSIAFALAALRLLAVAWTRVSGRPIEVWSWARGTNSNPQSPEPRADPALAAMEAADHRHQLWRQRFLNVLRWTTALTLAWCAISFLNARGNYAADANTGHPELVLKTPHIAFLPQSYNGEATTGAFANATALACLFWSVHHLLAGRSRSERDSYSERLPEHVQPSFPLLPARLRRLLWAFCLSGGLLALVSILQRLSGTPNLLWFQATEIGDAEFHFGPFNYRANGAQYFNLIWPLALGHWWITRVRHQALTQMNERAGTGPHAVLFPAGILMSACPMISTNRTGALLSFAGILTVYAALTANARQRNTRHRASLHAFFGCALAFALYLGWLPLEHRLQSFTGIRIDPTLHQRLDQQRATLQIVRDFPILGIGPGAFGSVYPAYAPAGARTDPFTHNDYLQYAAEWGVPITVLLLTALAISLLHPWLTGAEPRLLIGTIQTGIVLVLLHALIDFPLQIHALTLTLTILLAILVTLPSRHRA